MFKSNILAVIASIALGTTVFAIDGKRDSSAFGHGLEFSVDGEIPSVEGAADGWQETSWNFGQPPSLEVSGGLLRIDTVGVGGGHDVRQPTGTSAWATEVDDTTSYTFETRLRVTDQGGSSPGFSVWLGNGVAAETAVLQVRTNELMWGTNTQSLDTNDNSGDLVTVRIAFDAGAGLSTVYRDGVEVGTGLGSTEIQSANNWVILADFGGANEVAAEVDYVRWDATGAFTPAAKDSSTFPHALEFDTDGEIPSVEGAADGWQETGWNIPGNPPSLEVAGGLLTVKTVGVGGGHDVRQPVDTSAWAAEVDPGTSYTFEARVRVTNEGGADPGFTIWLGNGEASETAVAIVGMNDIRWGRNTTIHEGDNSSDFVTVRIGHDGATGLATVWRNGVEIATDLGPGDIQVANNWVILVDFGGSNEVDAEVDYVRWDATGIYEPDDGTRDASELAHKLLFDTDGEIPSVEGAADGWQETSWNFGQPPSLEVSGGLLRIDTVGVGGGHDVRQPTGTSAWATEVDDTTSYTFETRLRVTDQGGSSPGFSVWLGNGVAAETAVLQVRTNELMWGTNTQSLDTNDNSGDLVTVRIAFDAGTGLSTVYRDGVEVGTGLGSTEIQSANNWVILADFGGANEVAAEVDYVRWDATGAFTPAAKDSSTFPHALEFDTDGEIPSVEGAADGWQETGWNIPGNPPSLEVAGGLLTVKTVGVGGGHDVRQPVDTSAWAAEVDPGTSYTFEARVRVTNEGGADPGFTIWLGNGEASETAVAIVGMNDIRWGRNTTIHEGDNSSDFVTVRIGHDGATGLATVWRNGVEIATDLGPGDIQVANNWVILVDFGGSNEVDAEVDYVCWDATGIYPPPGGDCDDIAPAAPTGLIAAPGVGAIGLDWDSNVEEDVVGYNVYGSDTTGGPYDLIAEAVSSSDFVDMSLADGAPRFYVVTAVDNCDNESDPSDESSATEGFGEVLDADQFTHCLTFDIEGEFPSVEGAADGWTESASWNATEGEPPTLAVSGGVVQFNSVLPGQHSVDQPAGGASAWSTEIDGSTSFTFETSIRVASSEGGAILWIANGSNRLILRIYPDRVARFSDETLREGDNMTNFVTIRIGYDGISKRYWVWRNGFEIGAGLAPQADTGRTAIFLIDCCSSTQAEGEMDYVCWDGEGIFPPATQIDDVPPGPPTGLTAVGGVNVVALDWDTNPEDDVASYNVRRSAVTGGPYDLIAEGVLASEYIDDDVTNGVESFYVVTAVDTSGNESGDSDEASATPNAPEPRGAGGFHCLTFDTDGQLPSVEGAEQGWAEDAPWNANDPDPPTLAVFGGRLVFDSVLGGQQAITLGDGSTWEESIDANVSYTFEVRMKVAASSGDNGGVILWLANGSTRFILRVDTMGTFAWPDIPLDANENASDFVTFRIGYDAVSGLYFVWRDGVLIGNGLPPQAAAAGGRTAVFLIDCCSSVQVTGEFDHVCWTSTGIFGPAGTPVLAGDCNVDGTRNLSDVICGIHVLFPGFFLLADPVEPPCGTGEGTDAILDVSGNGAFDINDVISLARYLFDGGAPPVQGVDCFGVVEAFDCAGSDGCPADIP